MRRRNRESDGGIVPSEENFANAAKQLGITLPSSFTPADSDKIPAIAVQNEDIDIEIVSYLEPYDKIDDGLWNPKAMHIEARPHHMLEDTAHAGTLDFSPESLEKREREGYSETKELLEKL